MSDPASLTSLFAAAEQAAMAGDFATAARVLVDAARAQEAELGPDHLDLANTLNNLAVAHERSGQLDAAEREYRRAHAIAARTLPDDHPQVTTSAQNLREFCEANGRPLDAPRPETAVDIANESGRNPGYPSGDPSGDRSGGVSGRVSGGVPLGAAAGVPVAGERLPITFAADAPATPPAARSEAPTAPVPRMPAMEPRLVAAADPVTPQAARREAPPQRASPRPAVATPAAPIAARRSWLPVLLAVGAVGVLLIWLLAGRGPATPPATPQAASPEGSPPLTPSASPPASSPTPERPPAGVAAPPDGPRPSPTAPGGADGVSVGEARLCATLAPGYRCDPAPSPVRAGSLTFYTRIVATSETAVVHRWYRGGELRQAVRLAIPPRRGGFRTFSRATVSPADADWRVELRSRDGRLLHTETFTVAGRR